MTNENSFPNFEKGVKESNFIFFKDILRHIIGKVNQKNDDA